MNIGVSPVDTSYVIIGGLALLVAVPLSLATIQLLARLVAWIFRIQSGYFFWAWWLIWLVGLVAGTSLYFDLAAQRIPATVTAKSESIEVEREGGWSNHFRVEFEYQYAGELGKVMLPLGEAHYDTLAQAQRAELAIIPLYHTIILARLAAIHTAEWLATPLRWLAIILVVVFFIWRTHKIKSRTFWLAVFAGALVLAVLIPTYWTYHAWRSAEDLSARPLRAQATVTAVELITNIDYLPCSGSCSDTVDTAFDVPQQYKIVQMTYLPAGQDEVVLAADSADAGSLVTFVGDTLPIAYAANNPRTPQILAATHNHYWHNAIFFVATSVGYTILFFALQIAGSWVFEKIGERLAARTAAQD